MVGLLKGYLKNINNKNGTILYQVICQHNEGINIRFRFFTHEQFIIMSGLKAEVSAESIFYELRKNIV